MASAIDLLPVDYSLICAPVVPIAGVSKGVRALTLPSDIDRNADPAQQAVIFRGSKPLCREFSLVLEARGIEHEVRESGDSGLLTVPTPLVHLAYEEISRYSAERDVPRSTPSLVEPFPGAAFGAIVPELLETSYAHEIWQLYQAAQLTPDTRLTGQFKHDQTQANVALILDHIEAARAEAEARQRGRDARLRARLPAGGVRRCWPPPPRWHGWRRRRSGG